MPLYRQQEAYVGFDLGAGWSPPSMGWQYLIAQVSRNGSLENQNVVVMNLICLWREVELPNILFLNISSTEVRKFELKKDLPPLQMAWCMHWMHGAFTW